MCLGALLLTQAACEHGPCEDALQICRIAPGNQEQARANETASTRGLQEAVDQLIAKVRWPAETPKDLATGGTANFEHGKARKAETKRPSVVKQPIGANRT
jgi:hypothetical protein